MFHVALWEPEIPPNTGNIARLCAATGAELHLIGRLGFRIDDAAVKRAGLDYWEHVKVTHHADWPAFLEVIHSNRIQTPSPLEGEGRFEHSEKRGEGCEPEFGSDPSPRPSLRSVRPSPSRGEGEEIPIDAARIWLVDNPSQQLYTQAEFRDGDVLLFGSETRGLPEWLREEHASRLIGIPMPAGKVRSLNLSNAVAIVLYEALRQTQDWSDATVSN
jgi:tRNA (cytidine/uridine-2'-O-)-methyltransferase